MELEKHTHIIEQLLEIATETGLNLDEGVHQIYMTLLLLSFITDQFSGPGRAIGLVCVCQCLWVWTITIELNDTWPRYLITGSSWSCLVKSENQGHRYFPRSHDENVPFPAMNAHWEVSYWLFVEFFVLKWLVRPRVRAFQCFVIPTKHNYISMVWTDVWLCVVSQMSEGYWIAFEREKFNS